MALRTQMALTLGRTRGREEANENPCVTIMLVRKGEHLAKLGTEAKQAIVSKKGSGTSPDPPRPDD